MNNINHRKPLKRIFITFPKTLVSKQEFKNSIESLGIIKSHIVQESHKDGTKHLHAIIVLQNKLSKKSIISYFMKNYPGSYKRIHIGSVRSMKFAIAYLSKEDKDPLVSTKPLPSVYDMMYTNPQFWKKYLSINKYKINANI